MRARDEEKLHGAVENMIWDGKRIVTGALPREV